jgi:choline dehydrogenase-like flavoprotein
LILDLDNADLDAGLHAEVCVVGAGAVGIVLAILLAERGVDVLLLEGGGAGPEDDSQALHEGQSVGHPFDIASGRYRVLGGTTTQWSGQLVPIDASVVGARPWLGYDAWPLEPAVLAHYIVLAYRWLGWSGAELDDAAVWHKLGSSVPALGPDIDVVMSRWTRTTDFARLFGRRLRSRHGPRVLVHANVVSLELSSQRDRIRAVRARSLRGKQTEVSARHFVLANGTLEIVRLLKHPLTDGSLAPWIDSRWLGSPFVDHLLCTVGDVTVLDYPRFHEMFDEIFLGRHKYSPRLRLAPEAQRSAGAVDIAAHFKYSSRDREHVDYLKALAGSLRGRPPEGASWRELPRHVVGMQATAGPMLRRRIRERRAFKPKDAQVALVLASEQVPIARSRIELSEQRDALGMQRVRVDWQFDGRELQSMKFFAGLIKMELESRGLASVAVDPRLQQEHPAFLTEIADSIHHMGTTRMGLTPDDGFVDENLTVFGLENLRVIGATVFPTTGFANPTLTAIALALRLGDHLVRLSNG